MFRSRSRRAVFAALAVVAALAAVLVSTAPPASAVSPHFVRVAASFSGTSLTVTFKEAGLGDDQLIDYVLEADATAVYVCVNGGGNHPSAQNKTTVNGPVTASGSFASGKNGAINGSLTLTAPGPGGFTCPGGQTLSLADVSFTHLSLRDATDGVSADLAGTFDSGCLLPRIRNAC